MSEIIKFEEKVQVTKQNQPTSMKWYQYHQNNSGGYYVEPAQNVWVQGSDCSDIVRRFEALGFDDSYCPCCGERWSHPYDDSELSDEPEFYGEKLTELKEKPWQFDSEVPFGILIFADGSTQTLTIN